MAKRTWILTDLEQDLHVDQLALTPGHVPGAAAGFSVIKRTLRGGRRDGVDVIEVNNGTFRYVLIPTRGMGIWRASLGDLQLAWPSPVKGPVNPQLVRLDEASGIGWLDGYDEMLVRCGLESNGAPEFNANGTLRYPLHGRIANCPAHHVEVTIDGDCGEISVTGIVDEARLFGSKLRLTSTVTTRPGQPGCDVIDTVTNLSAEPGELELLYHINFGPPLAGPARRRCCRCGRWPRVMRWRRPTWTSGTRTARRRPGWGRPCSSSTWPRGPTARPGPCSAAPTAAAAWG